MAYIKKTTLVGSKSILMLYKCSKCGNTAIQSVSIKGAAAYSDSGAFTQGAMDRRRNAAEQRMEAAVDRKMERVITGGASAVRAAKMTCSCRKCGAKAPWSSSDYTGLQLVTMLGILIGMFGLGALGGYHHPIQLIPFVVVALAVVIRIICEVVKEIRTRKAFKACPPLFGESAEELLQRAKTIPQYLQ